jgi:hypothetical protein
MYHPGGASGAAADALEWFELYNPMGVDVDLSGWSVHGGVNFKFAEGTILNGGAYLVVAADPAALQQTTGYAGALGPFTGHLSDSGEKLELQDGNGREMDGVSYDTKGDWPVAPDGSGVSLSKIDPGTASATAANWVDSARVGGTPGAVNFTSPPAAPSLVFNEISPGADGFVEIANPTAAPQSAAGYRIEKPGLSPAQYVLPTGTTIAPHGFLALTPAQLGFTPTSIDKLCLRAPDGQSVSDAVAVPGGLRGRSPDGTGRWLIPSQATPGAANTFALHDDIVINEIMYHHAPQQAQTGSVDSSTLLTLGDNHWKYEQSGTDLGTAWRGSSYSDAGWGTGQGVFYGGNIPGVVGATTPVAIPGLYATGLNASGQTGAAGSVDPHYLVTAPGTSTPTPAIVMTPHPAWAGDDASSGWISPVQQGTDNQAAGDYLYTTTFNLDGMVPSSASLTLTLWADDEVKDVLINGQSTGIRVAGPGYAQPNGPFVISSGFVGGVNTLSFVVTNGGGSPNPAGFRAAISGTALPIPKNTQLTLGRPTYYFRNAFNFSGDPAKTQLLLDPLIDDGAVYYLNGVEIYRQNMPKGTIAYTTPASPAVTTPAFGTPILITLPPGSLKQGTNVLAVEVHQAAGDNSDVAMGLALGAVQTTPTTPFSDDPEQWIELYNRGAQAEDLSGWRLKDAVDYTFPAGTILAPDQYLVVAKDATALSAEYPAARIVGNFSGSLSHSAEGITLLDAAGNPADELHYYDSKPWPGAADGGGSSLELRDPSADNAQPEAWAASIEGTKSAWKTYTYSGVAVNLNGDPTQWNEFVLGLLDSGEVLLDDLSVIDTTGGANTSLLQNGTFENGTTAWRIIGNQHGTVVADPTNAANHVLDLVATGATESMHNHAETTLVGNTPIVNGHTYQISFRARWISGSNLLNTRLYFNRVSKTTVLDVPSSNGTPGARNSTWQANAGPTFSGLTQNLIYPSAGQAVTVSVRAEDPQGVNAVQLFYSVNGGSWSSTTMVAQGDGTYAGTIPGQAASATVQFYVSATDAQGAVSTFPAAGPASRALYKVNDGVALAPLTHTIRIVMTAADITRLYTTTNLMSNDAMGATVVYDNKEVFYDVGVSLHSSERGRYDDGRVGFNLDFNADHLFRGTLSSLTIDRSGVAEIVMRQAIAHAAGGVPSIDDDLVKVIAPRSQNTGFGLLDLDPYGNDYLDSAFKNGSNGNLYKQELIYYPTQTVDGNPQSLKIPQNDGVVGIDIVDLGSDKESYRYHYLLSNNRDADDFSDVMNLGRALQQSGAALDAASRQLLDLNEWLRLFALESLGGIGDVYGQGYQHNLKIYTRPGDGKMMALQWDWDYPFSYPTNASLVPDSNIGKLISLPTEKHLYYGNLQDIIATTFNSTYMSHWTSRDATLIGANYASYLTYIGQRAAYVQSQFPPQIPFAITTPSGQTTAQSGFSLTGKGWINVKEIYVQGSATPLDVTWSGTNLDTWTATVPLYAGLNHLTLLAYDFQGRLVGSQTMDLTSTGNAPNLPANIRVTELNYDPVPPAPDSPFDAQDFEFIELKNIGAQPIDVLGAHFTNAVLFTFGDVTLAPGQVGVVVRNLDAFRSRYGPDPFVLGAYDDPSTNFNNGGEHVTLLDADDRFILDFTYGDDPEDGWYPASGGGGDTLEVINPTGSASLSDPTAWRPSPVDGGTPGIDDSIPPAAAPASPTATAGGDRVTLSWAAVPGAAGYNVYRATTPGGEGATPLASGVTSTGFTDLTATGGVTYYYVITATNPGGEGPRSAEAWAHSHIPGDANDDGIVDFNDLVPLAQNYNAAGGSLLWSQGDFTGDGSVDFNDLVILAQRYTTAAAAAPLAASAKPAPTKPAAAPPKPAARPPFATKKIAPPPHPKPLLR